MVPCPIDELLETVGLERDGDKRVSQYSKGMKARLNFVGNKRLFCVAERKMVDMNHGNALLILYD